MAQAGRDPDLGLEPSRADPGGELGGEHLDRDLPVVPAIGGPEDGGHAAGADRPVDPIAASRAWERRSVTVIPPAYRR